MGAIIKLAKKNSNIQSIDGVYKLNYKQWKKNLELMKTPFFMLSKTFNQHLMEITSGALKLYLYYGFNSNNETGVSWHSIETISNYFGVSEKTINNWNKELIKRGLIYRNNKDNRRNKTTYLLPLSMVMYDRDILTKNFESFNLIPENFNDFRKVHGEIVSVYHLFQWRKREKINELDYTDPYNLFILVLRNKYNRFTCVRYIEDEYSNEIDTKKIYGDICIFDSNYKFEELDAIGIAVNSKVNLKNDDELYNLLNELLDKDTDLSNYQRVNLISF